MATPSAEMSEMIGLVSKFASVLSGVILMLAITVIIYAGFVYVTSQGDPYSTERAKNMIVSSGVGIVIALFANVILSILTSSDLASTTESESSPETGLLIGFLVLPFVFIIAYIIVKKVMARPVASSSEPITLTAEIPVSFDENMPYPLGEPLASLVETIETELEALHEKLDFLDIERRHKIETTIEKDLSTLLAQYQQLSEVNKVGQLDNTVAGLTKLQKEIENIQSYIEEKKLDELDATLRIIEERY